MTLGYYKSSNKFSVPGFLLLILSTAVVGTLVSLLYLKLQAICPSVYLCIAITVGFGLLLGLISKYLCKIFKMRNTQIAIIAVIVGILIYTAFKWTFWCSAFYTSLGEALMENYSSSEFAFVMEIINTSSPEDMIAEFGEKEYKVYSHLALLWDNDIDISSESYFSALSYYFTHPGDLIDGIIGINGVGTWGVGRHSDDNIAGIPLYLVWLGELFFLCAFPISMTIEQTKFPFIESDNDWAEEYKNRLFAFKFFSVSGAKPNLENDMNQLLKETPLISIRDGENYVKLTLFHSKDFYESYVNLSEVKFDMKNKRYNERVVMKYARVDINFFSELDALFSSSAINNFSDGFAEKDKVTSPSHTVDDIGTGNISEESIPQADNDSAKMEEIDTSKIDISDL